MKDKRKIVVKRRTTPIKERSTEVHSKKCKGLEKWYRHLMKERETVTTNPNTKLPGKRRELRSLEYYLERVKKPVGGK